MPRARHINVSACQSEYGTFKKMIKLQKIDGMYKYDEWPELYNIGNYVTTYYCKILWK